MREPTPTEKAVNDLEGAYWETAQAKVWREMAADALDRAKADYDKATDKEYACESKLDAAREKLRELLKPAIEEVVKP